MTTHPSTLKAAREISKTRSYHTWKMKQLSDPKKAANYLSAAWNDCPEMFKVALLNVAQAHSVATVARESGVTRENIYRALSKEGNPTLVTLTSVLRAVGVTMRFSPVAKVTK